MYRLIRFGETSLEYFNQVDQVGSGSTPVSYFNLADGGALDGYGSSIKSPGAVERTKSIRLQAATEQELSDLFFGLLKLRGQRDKLYRRMIDGDEHWMYARLVEVTAVRTFEQTKFHLIQDVELKFVCQEATWHGIEHTERFSFDDAVPAQTIYIACGSEDHPGRAPVRSMRIILKMNSPQVTAVIDRTNGETITLTPSYGYCRFVVDTGTMQVFFTNFSGPITLEEDGYQYFTFTPAADMANWFSILPGENEITITLTGSGFDVDVEFYFCEEWY